MDIAERRSGQTETQPEPSAGLADAILAAAHVARIGVTVTAMHDGSFRLLYASPVASTILGYDEGDYPDGPIFENVAPEDRPRIRELGERALRGEPVPDSLELLMLCRDGSTVPVQASVSTIQAGGRALSVTFLFDITERRLSEARLRESEARFRLLVEAAPEAIAILRHGRFVYVNPALVRLLGFCEAGEVTRISVECHLHPDDRAEFGQRLALVGAGQPQPTYVYRMLRRGGDEVFLEVNSMRIEFEGQPSVMSFGRDVSERKRMEAQLIQADRLAVLGMLAASVAHEINNPLTFVALNLEVLGRDLRKLDLGEARLSELLARIDSTRHGVDRVADIVRQLRVFSRSGDQVRTVVDVRRALATATNMAMSEIRHRASLRSDIGDLPRVLANEARLEQVFLNLLVNAAQAIGEGHPDENEVQISAHLESGGRLVVEVSDTGSGVPAAIRERIFDPFFTTKAAGIGTGLGLSICQSIVVSLGGELTVHDRAPRGTVFRVSLPTMSASEQASYAGFEPRALPAASRARVLIIDDERSLLGSLASLLQDRHEVTVCEGGAEGLARLLEEPPFDVAFCDLLMPAPDGVEIYERLRAERPGLEKRLVFMTGGSSLPRFVEFLGRVGNQTLEKPFALGAVEDILRAMGRRLARWPGVPRVARRPAPTGPATLRT